MTKQREENDTCCQRCGGFMRAPQRAMRVEDAVCRCGPGLGDIMASGLAAIGVTKERVQAVASAVGVKDCGCKGRQAALNKLGEKLGLPRGSTG